MIKSRYHASVEEWTSILTPALQCSFVDVKALAIRELEREERPILIISVGYWYGMTVATGVKSTLCESDRGLRSETGPRSRGESKGARKRGRISKG